MPLLSGERLIRQGVGRNSTVWLTSHRLVQQRQANWWGGGELATVAIPLDQISGMSMGYLRRVALLVIGGVFTLVGLFAGSLGGVATAIWFIGLVSIIAYVLTGRRGLIIKSDREQIRFPTRGMSADDIRAFAFALEKARAKLMGLEMEDEEGDEDGAGG